MKTMINLPPGNKFGDLSIDVQYRVPIAMSRFKDDFKYDLEQPIFGFYEEVNPNRFLSNMVTLDQPIRHEEVDYWSVENFFMAMKTTNPITRKEIARLTPSESKAKGRRVRLRPDWEQIKFIVMLHALREKFKIPRYKSLLLKTGDRYIEETNWWGDTFWGVHAKTQRGWNFLGILLMHVREELKTGYQIDFIWSSYNWYISIPAKNG